MAQTIKIKKGLNIKLIGEARKEICNIETEQYAVKPTDFIGVLPRLLVKEGDIVKAGTPLFADNTAKISFFTSPVSGVIEQVCRGDQRLLEEIRG